jgi:hypothetical protein
VVHKARVDQQVHKDHKASKVIAVSQDHKVHKDQVVLKAQLVRKVHQVHQVLKVFLVLAFVLSAQYQLMQF